MMTSDYIQEEQEAVSMPIPESDYINSKSCSASDVTFAMPPSMVGAALTKSGQISEYIYSKPKSKSASTPLPSNLNLAIINQYRESDFKLDDFFPSFSNIAATPIASENGTSYHMENNSSTDSYNSTSLNPRLDSTFNHELIPARSSIKSSSTLQQSNYDQQSLSNTLSSNVIPSMIPDIIYNTGDSGSVGEFPFFLSTPVLSENHSNIATNQTIPASKSTSLGEFGDLSLNSYPFSSLECLSTPASVSTGMIPLPLTTTPNSQTSPNPQFSPANQFLAYSPSEWFYSSLQSSIDADDSNSFEFDGSLKESDSYSPISSTSSNHSITLAIKGKSPYVVLWLRSNFESADGVSMPRSLLYTYFYESSISNGIEPVNAASFGKIIRSVFPNLRTRRLGTRGHSKYHYYGIRMKGTKPTNLFTDNLPFSPSLSSANSMFDTASNVPLSSQTNDTCSDNRNNSLNAMSSSLPFKIKNIKPMMRPYQKSNNIPTSPLSSAHLPKFSVGSSYFDAITDNNFNIVSCVTNNPPSIDYFSGTLQKICSLTLENIFIENFDFFKMSLQHHTTLLLSLLLREEFIHYEEEFSLYWNNAFPKTFPELFYHTKSIGKENSNVYPYLLSTIKQFDSLSFNVIQDCFLSFFWMPGITTKQLDSIKFFATNTLPLLASFLFKLCLGESCLKFDKNNWPFCKDLFLWNSASSTLSSVYSTPLSIAQIFTIKLLSVKLDSFKKLSSLLLKRVSLYLHATSLINSIYALNITTSSDGKKDENIKKIVKIIVREIGIEFRKHSKTEFFLHGLGSGFSSLEISSASFSFSLDDTTVGNMPVIPIDILCQLETSIDKLFCEGKENLDWELWSLFLESCINLEVGTSSRSLEMEIENSQNFLSRKNSSPGTTFNSINTSALESVDYQALERSLQRLLFQWSFVSSIFMDQLDNPKLLSISNMILSDKDLDSHAGVKTFSNEDDFLLSKYVHFNTLDLLSSESLYHFEEKREGVLNMYFNNLKAVFENLKILTEEYLLYLVERRLCEVKDSLVSEEGHFNVFNESSQNSSHNAKQFQKLTGRKQYKKDNHATSKATLFSDIESRLESKSRAPKDLNVKDGSSFFH